MGKKLIDIKQLIDSSGGKFYNYLHLLLHEDIMRKLEQISHETEVYIFSGIIRNYFLHEYIKRDIDVVIADEIDIYNEFENLPIKKNSFGGYKIDFPSGPLDLWYVKDTWAFKHQQTTLEFNLEKKIPETAFFNFSAIIFSLNTKEFYYSNHFVKFLKDKKLDYVYPLNANYPLCIVNTLYYSDRYNLKVSDRLSNFIKNIFDKSEYDFKEVQIKHFGRIIYSDQEIRDRLIEYHEA